MHEVQMEVRTLLNMNDMSQNHLLSKLVKDNRVPTMSENSIHHFFGYTDKLDIVQSSCK